MRKKTIMPQTIPSAARGFSLFVFLISMGFFYMVFMFAVLLGPLYYNDYQLVHILEDSKADFLHPRETSEPRHAEQFKLLLDQKMLEKKLPALESQALQIREDKDDIDIHIDYEAQAHFLGNLFLMLRFQHHDRFSIV